MCALHCITGYYYSENDSSMEDDDLTAAQITCQDNGTYTKPIGKCIRKIKYIYITFLSSILSFLKNRVASYLFSIV